MDNYTTEVARRYHNGTKHPDGDLLNRHHIFDPTYQPLLFKLYTELEPMPLSLNPMPVGMPALTAIATRLSPTGEERIPDLKTLTRILYFSAGITKKIKFDWEELFFRAAACTGALYHIELYLVCGDLPDLAAGVYHFDPSGLALKQLRPGDYRRHLIEAGGDEPHLAKAPAIIIYTDVFWRNACKYQAREYRHAFWDSGTILANTLAICSAHQLPAKVVAGFVDDTANRLLDLNPQREVALALVPVGYAPEVTIPPAPELNPLSLETLPISAYEIKFPAILEMHDASSLISAAEVAAWRGETPSLGLPAPAGRLFPLDPYPENELPSDSIEAVIIRRGSARQFARELISFRDLSTILKQATRGVPADFLNPPGATLNHLYLIVNAVEGLLPGTYVFHRDRQALELLQEGKFRQEAGYLGLGQALAADASVNIFFLTDLNPVLARFGNRGYRAAQLDASITAGRVYLAAYALHLGATGLTFFDDAVTEFFSPHAQGKSVMFMILIGKRAKRE